MILEEPHELGSFYPPPSSLPYPLPHPRPLFFSPLLFRFYDAAPYSLSPNPPSQVNNDSIVIDECLENHQIDLEENSPNSGREPKNRIDGFEIVEL